MWKHIERARPELEARLGAKLVLARASVRDLDKDLLTDLKDQLGLGMVFISHDIQTVRYLSDEIVVMNKGRIVEYCDAAQVFDNPSDPYTRKLLGAAPSLLEPTR